ncbi:MAG: YdcF family protein [Anaerolineales bacterium]
MEKHSFDCILIPGGGLKPDGSLPAWTTARLNYVLDHAEETTWIGLLSGGTVHKPPPLNSDGFPLFESRQAAAYLISQGIEPSKLLTEIASYDTIGNAYFSRMLFADPFSLTRLQVVTSAFHLPRTKAIFNWIYSLTPAEREYELSFAEVPNQGLGSEALQARREREKLSLNKLLPKIKSTRSLDGFNRWLYSEHAAYSPILNKEQLTENELKSY